jgi:hypothetical protein
MQKQIIMCNKKNNNINKKLLALFIEHNIKTNCYEIKK